MARGTIKVPRGKSFSQRNPTTIGAIGIVVIVALLWASFNAERLPIIGGGTVYNAQFSEAAGLVAGDEVRIAGVKVGAVRSVALQGDHVEVAFRVKNAYVGDTSTVAIKIKTVLGRKYVALDSTGADEQDPDTDIPRSRTISPYDIYPAFSELTKTVGSIDSTQLAKSFETLASTFADTPASVKSTLSGLQRLSTTISSRDDALRTLLARANSVTTVLANRDSEIQTLLHDGALLFQELDDRRAAIASLFTNTSNLAAQLSGLVADNRATIGPALDQLNGVLKILNTNADNIARGLQLFAPFARVFANVLGNGRWFDTYIQNFTVPGLLCLSVPLPIGTGCG